MSSFNFVCCYCVAIFLLYFAFMLIYCLIKSRYNEDLSHHAVTVVLISLFTLFRKHKDDDEEERRSSKHKKSSKRSKKDKEEDMETSGSPHESK